MADPPAQSVPAEAVFRVFVDDEEVWTGQAKTGDRWKEAKVQLRRWAGKNVTIRFETLAGESSVGDFCAFSNPEVVGTVDDAEPRRIVMVGIDTLRPDHLGVNGGRADVSPALDRIASESFVFSHARAPAPRTRPSFRTATTGRWPLLAIGSPTMGELMRKEGFASAGIVANVHLMARLGMAAGYHHRDYDPKRNSKAQVDKALAWLNDHANEDSFLFLHIMDPHIFYLPPEPYRDRYTEGLDPGPLSDKYNRWTVQALERKDELSDENRAYVRARYDGEIAYVDSEVGRLVQAVDELPGRTTMVFISDHGEEFWEHGAFEHNHSLYDELMRVLLWIRPPGGQAEAARVIDAPVSLADVVPTMLDLTGVQASVEFDGVSLRPMLDELYSSQRSALDAALQERLFPLGHMMFAKERWGVFSGGRKYILHTMSGEEELYDLTADPAEQTNRTDTETGALREWRDKLAAATGATVSEGWRISMSAKTPAFRLVSLRMAPARWYRQA